MSAFVLVIALPLLTAVGLARAPRDQRRFQIESWLGEHRFGPHDLVVLPSDELLALSVVGSSSQIVVSKRLVDTPSPTQFTAVVRHEAAHLEHGHQRFLLLVSALEHGFAVVPGLRGSTRALRAALEPWPDEVATGQDDASRAVLRQALLRLSLALVNPAVAAFAAAEAVVERLDAPRRRRPDAVHPSPGRHLPPSRRRVRGRAPHPGRLGRCRLGTARHVGALPGLTQGGPVRETAEGIHLPVLSCW